MKSKESFIFHKIWWENTRHLPTEAQCEIYDTLFRYVFEGIEPTFDPLSVVSMAMKFIKERIDADNNKYIATCGKRAAAGRRGGLAKQANARKQAKSDNNEQQTLANIANANFAKQTLANLADTDTDTESDTDTEKINTDFLFLEAEKKEKIIFDFSLILLSEGRPNSYTEAVKAYDFNESTSWETTTEKKNGQKSTKKIKNKLSWLKGWQRSNEQLFAPRDGSVLAKILQNHPIPGMENLINYFRGIRDEDDAITFLFSNHQTSTFFMNEYRGELGFRSAIIKVVKENFPNANMLYSKTI